MASDLRLTWKLLEGYQVFLKRLRSCTASRFCRACCVSSKRSNERAAIHVGSVFFRLHSVKYRKENKGIPKNQQVLLAHSEVYVYINSVAKNA